MKVVIAHRSGQPRVVSLPEPRCSSHFVTVRVSHTAMRLPQELETLELAPRRTPKNQDGLPLGATASGTIMTCGNQVKRLKAGLRVAVTGAPYVYHAEQLVVPENLVVELPKKVNHEEGAFVGQGAVAINLLRTAQVQLGEIVIIMGADLLGLLTAQVVKAAGAIPILIDDSEFRLKKAAAVAVSDVYTPNDDRLFKFIDTLTEGNGVDAVLLTRSYDSASFSLAVDLVRYGGTIASCVPIGANVMMDDLLSKGLSFRSAIGAGAGHRDTDYEVHGAGYPRTLARWTERENMACFAQLLSDRKVQVTPLVSDRIPLDRAVTAYEKALRGRDAVLGVVLTV